MNRIQNLFQNKTRNICSIYLTAGYPHLDSTVTQVLELEKQRVDMVEIGMPFSDPLADGTTIQKTSKVALVNGMKLKFLLNQIKQIRRSSEIPIVLMGYFNPILAYGLEEFLQECEHIGVDGVIIPDISLEEYSLNYQKIFEQYHVPLSFLVTPKTELSRLMQIVQLTETFVYFVSSSSTTGKKEGFSEDQINVFQQFQNLQLKVPVMMGFGIYDGSSFSVACKYFNGGIIGSAYLRSLENKEGSVKFIEEILSQV